MKPISGRRLVKVLEARGWLLRRINGSHHILNRPGTESVVSVPVHGNQDLRPGTQRRLMRDSGLTDADL